MVNINYEEQQKLKEKKLKLELASRIKEAIATLPRGSKVEISKRCDVSTTAITGWEKVGSIDKKNLAVVANMTNYSLDWLITGKGDKQALPSNIAKELTNKAQPPGDEFIAVHFGSFKLEAGITGFSIDYLDEELPPIFFRDDWLKRERLNANKLIACRISGSSMEPRLYSGDCVVINTELTKPIDGKVFAVNYEGEMVIKRLQRDSGHWFLSSDNSDKTLYPNKLCSGDICILIGMVVHRQSTRI